MHHLKISLLTLLGCVFIAAGVSLMFTTHTAPVFAQDDEEREYMGARECSSCHRSLSRAHDESAHSLTLREPDDDVILADFDSGEDVRTVLFPADSESRPFTEDDVAFVVGTGRYVQRYLYEVDRNEYMVFPAEWNTLTGEWEPFTLAEEWTADAYGWAENCAFCHTTGFNPDRGNWEDDGVQCEACHGPGSVHLEVVDDLDEDDITGEDRALLENSINIGLDSQVCGQCHSQGFEPEEQRPYPVKYLPGQTLLDEDVFQLYPQDDPIHWWATGQGSHQNMQFNEWLNTGHSQSLTDLRGSEYFEVACLNCHNTTYKRAVSEAVLLESDEDTGDYEDFMRAILDELGGDDSRGDVEELQARFIETLELDASSINANQSFITQVMPQIITHLHDTGDLEESAFLPQSLDTILNAIADPDAELSQGLALMGVTCAGCHNPHNEQSLNLVNEDTYTLCTDCHNNNTPIDGIHHPVQEMFEGIALVENVQAVPGAHFGAEEGPRCTTCHMPTVPVDTATRASHFMSPILPGEATDIEALQDACSGCHAEQVSTGELQGLVESIQTDTQQRLDAARQSVSDETPQWVVAALDVVEGDGSRGIHNYEYTGALLASAEREMGMAAETTVISAPVLPAPLAVDTEVPTAVSGVVQDGLKPAGIVLLAIAAGILLVSAYIFFIRQGDK